uniref:small monomeric GTPase n=1 Tax=Crocodylus porosus TaxID=8502 RepID=A0A7M4EKB3_CROPO
MPKEGKKLFSLSSPPTPTRLDRLLFLACVSPLRVLCHSILLTSSCFPYQSILFWTVCPTKSSSSLYWVAATLARQDDNDNICCQEQINRSIYWADGFVFVYSITDYNSYRLIRPLYQHIRKIHPNANIPLLLMANKGDLLRARQVSSKEGLQLASELGGTYSEVSARENCEGVQEAFQHLCQELSRMIGSCNGEKRRGLHLIRPKSPNMQDLKRRLKQALTSKGKSATTL